MAAGLRVCADSGYSQVQVWLNQTSVEGIEAFAPVLELVQGEDDRGFRCTQGVAAITPPQGVATSAQGMKEHDVGSSRSTHH